MNIYISLSLSIYIYIYIERERERYTYTYRERGIDSSVGRIMPLDPEGPEFDPGLGHN